MTEVVIILVGVELNSGCDMYDVWIILKIFSMSIFDRAMF